MGGPAGQFKTFADATGAKWFTSAWRDKIASGFSVSSSPSGDKFSTLQYLFTLAMQHGMLWVGLGEMPMQPNGVNRLGAFSGAMGQAGQATGGGGAERSRQGDRRSAWQTRGATCVEAESVLKNTVAIRRKKDGKRSFWART